jgi:hypothetical protein
MFTWDGLLDIADEPHLQRDSDPNEIVDKSCSCEGPSCSCCLDFNLSFIDLGGPGEYYQQFECGLASGHVYDVDTYS